MKNILGAALLATLSPAFLSAESYATVIKIKPNYQTKTISEPQRRCQNVEVPIYGTSQTRGASSSDVLGGMIIGGLLGGTVSGKDRGAAAGAVIGGLMAADQGQQTKRFIVGYRSEQQCNLVQVNTKQSHIKNYRITYEWNGIRGKSYTYNNYRIGDQIPINVSISAK